MQNVVFYTSCLFIREQFLLSFAYLFFWGGGAQILLTQQRVKSLESHSSS